MSSAPKKIALLLRGETFRAKGEGYSAGRRLADPDPETVHRQLDATRSHIRYLVQPLAEFGYDVDVYLTTYTCEKNAEIVRLFQEAPVVANVALHVVPPEIEESQYNSLIFGYLQVLNSGNEYEAIVITRLDLTFKMELPASEIKPDKFLFQWNLFHHKKTKEMADQIHVIGKVYQMNFVAMIEDPYLQEMSGLHNLYNVVVKHIGEDSIDFLLYLVDPAPDDNRSPLRGNPGLSVNPMYFDSNRQIATELCSFDHLQRQYGDS